MLALFVAAHVAAVAPAQSCSDLEAEVTALRARVKTLEAEREAKAPSSGAPAQTTASACAIDVHGAPMMGTTDAKLHVVFFMDLQDPLSARMMSLADDIAADPALKGKVAVHWKDFPLSYHRIARGAAVIARGVRAVGGDTAFFQFARTTFAHQRMDQDRMLYDDAVAHVPSQKLQETMESDNPRFERAIDDDIIAAKRCNVRGTPTIFVNGWVLEDRSVEGVKALATAKKLW